MRVIPHIWREDVGWVLIASEFSKSGDLSLDSPQHIKDAENAFGLSEHSVVAVKCIATKNLTICFNRLREGNPNTRKIIPEQPAAPLLKDMVAIVPFA